MAGDFILQQAERAMAAGIKECSKNYQESPQRAIDLITEAAKTIGRYFRNQPTIRSEVLGGYLFEAAMKLRVDAVEELKELGAHPDWRDASGKTALQKLAMETKDEAGEYMIRTLSGVGADIDAPILDDHGLRLIHAVVRDLRVSVLEVLAEIGVSVNVSTENSLYESPLHILAKLEHSSTAVAAERTLKETLQVAEILLDAGADPHLTNHQCMRPIQQAVVGKGHDQLVLRLLDGIAYPQETLNWCLVAAVNRNKEALVDPLIEAGADVLMNWEGRSLVEIAADRKQGQASEQLQRRIASLITQAQVAAAMPEEPAQSESAARPSSTPSPL